MKRLLEILVAIIFHPIAWILMLFNILGRADLDDGKKILWALVGILWGLGPILYLLLADGSLW